jgi:diguanylate cyclase (GGDEF)-like protein
MDITPASILIPAFWVSAGIILYTGIQAAVVGFVGHRVPIYLAFAATCFCAALYQIALVGYYTADSLNAAASSLRWQYASIIFYFPAFFVFVAMYTGQQRIKTWLTVITLVFAIPLIANFTSSPYSIRFETLELAAPLQLPWGESLSRFSGSPGLYNGLVRVAYSIILFWALWRTVVQYRRGERRMALFLATCISLLFVSSIWGALIDLNIVNSFYVAGFAYLGLALFMSISLGLELRDRTHRLHNTTLDLRREIDQRVKTEQAIRHIAAGVSSETGDLFFQRLVVELAQLFNADYAFIGMLDERQPHTVNTLAVCAFGKIAGKISYSTEDTPCANVIGLHTCVYPQGVSQQFPEDQLLREMSAESYIGTPLSGATGQPLGLIVVLDGKPMADTKLVVDILEIFAARAAAEIQRLTAESQLRLMAYQDYLTGMANRAQFHDHLATTIAHAQRDGSFGAMLLIDLDHFKTINDALSHDVGDQVLKEIARRLLAIGADHAFVARLGGDEFVAVLRTLSASQHESALAARQLAEAVMKELSGPITVGEHVLNVGASIGIAPFPHKESTSLDTLRQADMALYRAKNLGRSTIQFYAPPMQAAADERLQLEKGLRAALAQNQFTLHFQPQLDAAGRAIGAEALLRWHHPQLGDVPPTAFIPVAEETGLIHAIGAWVFDQACECLNRWLHNGVPFTGRLAINVSPWQFTRPDFVRQIGQILARRGVDPKRLTLEITETALLYDVNETIEKLKALRTIGLMISLDDFGTGYSSLAYLKTLPLDELKIDRAFVSELSGKLNHALIESMLSVGGHMALHIIAEGVESSMQREVLVAMGCERFQGFYFSHPLAENDFLPWLAANRERLGRGSKIA